MICSRILTSQDGERVRIDGKDLSEGDLDSDGRLNARSSVSSISCVIGQAIKDKVLRHSL